MAVEGIVFYACSKIYDGDVIVTYGYSSVVEETFLFAAEKQNKRFHVVVIDSFPRFEGRKLLEALSKAGVPCTYLLISAAAYMMRGANTVMIGAAGVRANGNVSSRCGTASVCVDARVQVLNLTYDTTPMRYITVIVTELGLIPPSRCRRRRRRRRCSCC